MTRHARVSHRPSLAHDLEALALAAGIVAALLALCLASAMWPDVF